MKLAEVDGITIHSVVFSKHITGTCRLPKDRGTRTSPAAVAGRTGRTKLLGVGGVERCEFSHLKALVIDEPQDGKGAIVVDLGVFKCTAKVS